VPPISDPLLCVLAPPLDSIRPGDSFSIATLPFFLGWLYATALDLDLPALGAPQPAAAATAAASTPRSGGGATARRASFTDDASDSSPLAASAGAAAAPASTAAASMGARDPLAPLTGSVSQRPAGRRVAVVLGQSYLVLAELIASRLPGQTSSRRTSGAPGVARRADAAVDSAAAISGSYALKKARALAVCPLHTSFSFIPPQAPHILDIRIASREAIPLAAALVPVNGPLAASRASAISFSACVLVLEDSSVAAHAAMHIDSARRRITGGKLDAILRLSFAPWDF
jgi:hypothetical protein